MTDVPWVSVPDTAPAMLRTKRDQVVRVAVAWHAQKATGDELIRAVDVYLEDLTRWSEALGGDEGEERPADAFGAATGRVEWGGSVFGDAKVIPLRGAHSVTVTYAHRELQYGVEHFEKIAQVVPVGTADATCSGCSWSASGVSADVERLAAEHQGQP